MSRHHAALIAVIVVALPSLCSAQPAGWQEFRSREGRFLAHFPGKPKMDSKELEHRDGQSTYIMWSAKNNMQTLFAVSYVDFPAITWKRDGPKVAINDLLQGMCKAAASKPASAKEVIFQGNPGLSFVVPFKAKGLDGEFHGRIYAVGHRAYLLQVMGFKAAPPDFAGSLPTQADMCGFFQSFKLSGGEK
jgi:hypothetical protein